MMTFPRAQEGASSFIYDVFLNFRGADIRNTFLAPLYSALCEAGFCTFKDDVGIERGENIDSKLKEILKAARSSIIVFSKGYASSKWCLDELVMILKHSSISRHKILPVFYHVDPKHVRNQTGSFEEAFRRHEARIEMEMDERKKQHLRYKLEGWRAALKHVSRLAGMVLADPGSDESEFIQKIVIEIDSIIEMESPAPPCIPGLPPHISEMPPHIPGMEFPHPAPPIPGMPSHIPKMKFPPFPHPAPPLPGMPPHIPGMEFPLFPHPAPPISGMEFLLCPHPAPTISGMSPHTPGMEFPLFPHPAPPISGMPPHTPGVEFPLFPHPAPPIPGMPPYTPGMEFPLFPHPAPPIPGMEFPHPAPPHIPRMEFPHIIGM